MKELDFTKIAINQAHHETSIIDDQHDNITDTILKNEDEETKLECMSGHSSSFSICYLDSSNSHTPDLPDVDELNLLRGVVGGYKNSIDVGTEVGIPLAKMNSRFIVSARWWSKWCDYINSEIKSPYDIYERRVF